MNGYKSRIFEFHDLPGGLCTAWERRGYVFDGCIHYLFGTGPGQPFSRLWEQLGLSVSLRPIHHDELMRVVDTQERAFIVYTDPDRLEDHMKDLSPKDGRHIEAFAEGVRRFTHFDMSLMQQKPSVTRCRGLFSSSGNDPRHVPWPMPQRRRPCRSVGPG
jgi:phytoene dehydrogenase-like protein